MNVPILSREVLRRHVRRGRMIRSRALRNWRVMLGRDISEKERSAFRSSMADCRLPRSRSLHWLVASRSRIVRQRGRAWRRKVLCLRHSVARVVRWAKSGWPCAAGAMDKCRDGRETAEANCSLKVGHLSLVTGHSSLLTPHPACWSRRRAVSLHPCLCIRRRWS